MSIIFDTKNISEETKAFVEMAQSRFLQSRYIKDLMPEITRHHGDITVVYTREDVPGNVRFSFDTKTVLVDERVDSVSILYGVFFELYTAGMDPKLAPREVNFLNKEDFAVAYAEAQSFVNKLLHNVVGEYKEIFTQLLSYEMQSDEVSALFDNLQTEAQKTAKEILEDKQAIYENVWDSWREFCINVTKLSNDSGVSQMEFSEGQERYNIAKQEFAELRELMQYNSDVFFRQLMLVEESFARGSIVVECENDILNKMIVEYPEYYGTKVKYVPYIGFVFQGDDASLFTEKVTFDFSKISHDVDLVLRTEKLIPYLNFLVKNTEALKQLIEEATAFGSIVVCLVQSGATDFGAFWDKISRSITVEAKIGGELDLMRMIVFELCNAANKEVNAVDMDGFQSADDYAVAVETAEHKSYDRSIDLMIEMTNKNPELMLALVRSFYKDSDSQDCDITTSSVIEEFELYRHTIEDYLAWNTPHTEHYRVKYTACKISTEYMQHVINDQLELGEVISKFSSDILQLTQEPYSSIDIKEDVLRVDMQKFMEASFKRVELFAEFLKSASYLKNCSGMIQQVFSLQTKLLQQALESDQSSVSDFLGMEGVAVFPSIIEKLSCTTQTDRSDGIYLREGKYYRTVMDDIWQVYSLRTVLNFSIQSSAEKYWQDHLGTCWGSDRAVHVLRSSHEEEVYLDSGQDMNVAGEVRANFDIV